MITVFAAVSPERKHICSLRSTTEKIANKQAKDQGSHVLRCQKLSQKGLANVEQVEDERRTKRTSKLLAVALRLGI